MRQNRVLWLFLLLFLTALLGCARQVAATPVPETAAAVRDEPAWEREWKALVAAAQKEGKVSIYTALKPEAREALTASFKEKYGIQIEWVVGRGTDLPPKIRAERNAGLYLADIGLIGAGTFINDLKPMNAAPSLEAMFLLPEVKDASKWFGGKIPFIDEEKQAIAPVLRRSPPFIRNTEKVKADEVTASVDLLKPVWKQKIVMFDPSVGGNANMWYTVTHTLVLGMDGGRKFMMELAKQEPAIFRDDRIIVESVARGKYLIGIGASPSVVLEFMHAGATVDFLDVKEPWELSPGAGLLNAFTNPPHPNAQKLFVNWILSREGLAVLARGEWVPARTDVPPEGILPILAPRPQDVVTSVETELLKGKMRSSAREIFGALMK